MMDVELGSRGLEEPGDARPPKERQPFRPSGWIENIRCENFMCHQNLSVDFIPYVNFITGQNGSGKSAILAALRVAFGVTARQTERGSSFRNLIREGCNQALISVRVHNGGDNPFKPEVYGDTIIVERKLTMASTTYCFKDARGKKVADKKQELEDMRAFFHIDAENPCVLMTQDKSRDFLHTGTDKERFKFFYAATLLEESNEGICAQEGDLALIKASVEQIRDQIGELKKELEREERAIGECDDLDARKADLFSLKEQRRRRKGWKVVTDTEEEMPQLEKELATKQRQVKEAEEMLQDSEEKLRSAKEAKEKNDCVGGADDEEEITRLGAEAEQAATARQQAKYLEDELFSGLKRSADEIKALRLRLQRHEKEVKDVEEEMLQETQAQAMQHQHEIEASQRRLEESRCSHERLREEVAALESLGGELSEKLRAVLDQKGEAGGNLSTQRGYLNRLQQLAKEGGDVRNFGGPRMLDLLRKIEESQRRFQRPPIGPVGSLIKLNDDRCALAVDVAVGNIMDKFIVHSLADCKLLGQLAREVNCQISITIYSFDVPRIEPPQYAPPGVRTVLGVLQADIPVVANVLIDHGKAEQVGIVADYEEGKALVFSRAARHELTACITMNDGTKLFSRGGQTVTLRKQPRNVGRLKKDNSEDIARTEGLVRQLEAALQECQREEEGCRRELQLNRTALEALKGRLRAAAHEQNAAAGELRDAEERARVESQAQSDAEARHARVGELESAINDLKAQLEAKEREQAALQAEYEGALEATRQALERSNRAAAELKALDRKLKEAEDARRESSKIVNDLTAGMEHYSAHIEKFKRECANAEAAVSKKQELLAAQVERASEICARELGVKEWELPMAKLEVQIRQLEKEVHRLDKPTNAKDGVDAKRHHEEKRRKLQKTIRRRERAEDLVAHQYDELCASVSQRRKQFQRALRNLTRTMDMQFKGHLHSKGWTGSLQFDLNANELSLEVTVRTDESQTAISDARVLSGGERSFATLCFALTLQENVEAPFRAMDEFDIFMDDVTRKMCLKSAVDFAIRHGSQWIFITPHNIDSVEATDMVKKQVLGAPRRAQPPS